MIMSRAKWSLRILDAFLKTKLMQNIPRIFGAIITVGFFLNWYSVDLLGVKMSFSGFSLAKIGGERYLLFIIPLAGIFSAAQPGRGNHAGSALLTCLFLMIFGPNEAGRDILTREVGWWLCGAAADGQLITCFLAPKEEVQSPLVKSMMGTNDESSTQDNHGAETKT